MSEQKVTEGRDKGNKTNALSLLIFLFLVDLVVYSAILAGPHIDDLWPILWAVLLTLTGVGHFYVLLQGAMNLKLENTLVAVAAVLCLVAQFGWTAWGFVFWMLVNLSPVEGMALIGVIVVALLLAATELVARSLAYNQVI